MQCRSYKCPRWWHRYNGVARNSVTTIERRQDIDGTDRSRRILHRWPLRDNIRELVMSFNRTFESGYSSLASLLISGDWAGVDNKMENEPTCPSCSCYGRPDTRPYGQSLHGSLSITRSYLRRLFYRWNCKWWVRRTAGQEMVSSSSLPVASFERDLLIWCLWKKSKITPMMMHYRHHPDRENGKWIYINAILNRKWSSDPPVYFWSGNAT